jgi:poly(3-hydroxybutyrate) depolymerase
MLLPPVLLSIAYLFANALQHSDGLFTDALPSGGHNFLRHGKLHTPKRDNTHVITVTVEDDARSHAGSRQERRRFLERTFRVFEPANKGDAKRPLILAYHGVMSDSETMRKLTQFDREAKDRGWLAVYPQGEWMYSEKMTNWNGAGCCSQGQDDIAFTKDMIDYMVQHFNVDENKVYVAGVSNGGFMVYKLLCEMGNRENGKPWIAAAGVHSGLLGAWQADFSSCSISKEIPLVHFHGLADPVVNVTGKPKMNRNLVFLLLP